MVLDSDLAELYGVSTKRFNEAVKRNLDRFPVDFSFSLEDQDVAILRSQIATSSEGHDQWGGRRYRPRVFTEHGAIMAATILNSARSASALKKSVATLDADNKFDLVYEAILGLVSPAAKKQ